VWGILKTIVAIALVVCVLAVCISPFVNLDPTSLSASKAALALSLAIVGSAFLFCYVIPQQLTAVSVPGRVSSSSSLLQLLCSRIC
jgi:hypothetical protein